MNEKEKALEMYQLLIKYVGSNASTPDVQQAKKRIAELSK